MDTPAEYFARSAAFNQAHDLLLTCPGAYTPACARRLRELSADAHAEGARLQRAANARLTQELEEGTARATKLLDIFFEGAAAIDARLEQQRASLAHMGKVA